jgi:hypothetical protein
MLVNKIQKEGNQPIVINPVHGPGTMVSAGPGPDLLGETGINDE